MSLRRRSVRFTERRLVEGREALGDIVLAI